MNKPVSQFITDRGCLIQGVMNDEKEMEYIYCPEHRMVEHVYSFEREIDLRSRPSSADWILISRLKAGLEYDKEELKE